MKKFALIYIPLFLLLTSCEKELDFHYHDVDRQLVIEGSLTRHGADVSLRNTTPMDEPMDRTPITDATVTIRDLTDGTCEHLYADAEGIFRNDTPGIVGHDYRLEVKRGEKNYASVCTMTSATDITGLEFQWIKMPYDYVAVLQVSFTDSPGTGDCYWVRLTRNGRAYRWTMVDDSHAEDGIINEVIMTTRKDIGEEDEKSLLLPGDVVGVTVTPISQDMLDYLMALEADSNGPRMFDGDYCLGYFIAAPVADSSIVFNPDDMTEYK
ncbi:MAG: DUF4249 family protein [Bacteroidales bacterium]|nr:DUF4249 family protein [Bacteroidales bacterium]